MPVPAIPYGSPQPACWWEVQSGNIPYRTGTLSCGHRSRADNRRSPGDNGVADNRPGTCSNRRSCRAPAPSRGGCRPSLPEKIIFFYRSLLTLRLLFLTAALFPFGISPRSLSVLTVRSSGGISALFPEEKGSGSRFPNRSSSGISALRPRERVPGSRFPNRSSSGISALRPRERVPGSRLPNRSSSGISALRPRERVRVHGSRTARPAGSPRSALSGIRRNHPGHPGGARHRRCLRSAALEGPAGPGRHCQG